MHDVTVTDLAYMAGVIDSDGSIGVKKSTRVGEWAVNYTPRIKLSQVTPQAPELMKATFGGTLGVARPGSPNGRSLYMWTIHSAAAARVATALLPYLRIKHAQALNALELAALTGRPRRFPVPDVIPGEPLIPLTEVAARLGKGYSTVLQAVRAGSVPSVRTKRSGCAPCVFIPESFLPVWASRGTTPVRDPALTAAMHALYLRAKELNRVGV